MTAATLSSLIDQWCVRHELDRAQLATRARIYPGSLSRVLSGRHKLDRMRAERLAVVLDCDAQQLLDAARHLKPVRGRGRRPGPSWRSIIDEALSARGYTIGGFADLADLSHGSMFDVLRGAREISPKVARPLVEHLGIDLAALLAAAGIEVPDGLAGQLMLQRWRNGWTRSQLARRVHTTGDMIGKLEQGVLPQRSEALLRVCACLGVEPPEITAAVPPTSFGRVLQERMRSRQMTVTQLAEQVGVSRLAASQWLAGAHPRPQKMTALSTVLGDPGQKMRQVWQQHRDQLPRPSGRRSDGLPRKSPRSIPAPGRT